MDKSLQSTFSYILLRANVNKQLKQELTEIYWGDIIEAFMECEEQWIEPSILWPFEWGNLMHRISVVQLVSNYNPCNWLSGILSYNNKEPLLINKDDDGVKIVFRNGCFEFSKQVDEVQKNPYYLRFIEVFKLTTELTCQKYKDIIFIGGKGFSLDQEIDLEDQISLQDVGLPIASRLPKKKGK